MPLSGEPAEDFTKLPPASKRFHKKTPKSGSPNYNTVDRKPSTTSRQPCAGCGKLPDPGVRYCVVCGHNNFDADVAAVSAHMKSAKENRKTHRITRRCARTEDLLAHVPLINSGTEPAFNARLAARDREPQDCSL